MATFKTRARTLDMLGRQQIAGIPTAISELFKNAHDAYADRVEIDYYRTDGLFVLRDDGMGMTEEEFIGRWLTIGTESKLNAAGIAPPPHDPSKKQRPMLGEKGIGRLAIATIGPQVLVLTRAKRDESLSDLTVAFMNWRLFECPGIDLEDIEVPIHSFPGGELPSHGDVSEIVREFRENVERLKMPIGKESYSRLIGEIERFDVDPRDIDFYLGDPTLRGTGAGTHFIISPSSDLLPADIDGEPEVDKATPLTKALLGFTNTMTPEHSRPVIRAAFRDHKTEESAKDLIAEGEFFMPDEFRNADHQVMGRFDEFGQFKGRVSIYGDAVDDHVIPWRGAKGNPTDCGPFTISFAAIEGLSKHSTLPPEDFALMSQKMGKIGGLYIYRDGVRILPYGNTDYDWLDIEFQRTKSAYYYYFSHRKMFGVVEIDHRNNHQLSEKAGREGFRENRAYRQFKSILKNFFLQVAADFFRKEGTYSDRFEEQKAELEKMELDRRRREQQVSKKKATLADGLRDFFERVSSNAPQEESLRLTRDVSEKLKQACQIADPQQAAEEIIRVEQHARTELQNLESRYKIPRPRIALSKAMQKEWGDYTAAFSDLTENVFRRTRELIEDIVGDEAAKARIAIDRRLRAEAVLEELAQQAKRNTKDGATNAKRKADRVATEVRGVASACINEVDTELRAVMSEFQRTDVSRLSDEDFVGTRDALESRIIKVTEERSTFLESILAQLEAIDLTGETSALDQLVAIEQRNQYLEEEAEADLQLAQLGMAVEIINHEFNATIRSLRNNLRRLKGWADINEDLAGLYRNIRASFDHLDGYLTLFTPLQRRLYRKAVDIHGSEIHDFLADLFQERFARHDVSLVRTDAFSRARIKGYPSSFYPVFVNLVDNAVYWLSQQNLAQERRIELDAADGAFLISDSGPGVNTRDREAIFEFGFTRKPGGRGMGLHISREALRRVGYDLVLAEGMAAKGATFVIRPVDLDDEDGSNRE
ncbi:ATP-binding protein [Candidatus Thiosymbion oneisti]|uniref:ATP-binding protein n=1 Tax=Candidatus Thiosymbion oneisti TaxID=589554 RepID=UPI000AADA98C|nr:ATP-binding protein [Candidatus Thiosymbion oneisti]